MIVQPTLSSPLSPSSSTPGQHPQRPRNERIQPVSHVGAQRPRRCARWAPASCTLGTAFTQIKCHNQHLHTTTCSILALTGTSKDTQSTPCTRNTNSQHNAQCSNGTTSTNLPPPPTCCIISPVHPLAASLHTLATGAAAPYSSIARKTYEECTASRCSDDQGGLGHVCVSIKGGALI